MSAATVEGSLELDVNLFNREGWLDEDGQAGRLQWTRERTGDEVAEIGYAYVDDDDVEAVVVFYTITPTAGDGEPRDLAYPIPIERTPCNFGGERPWFNCPECDDRVVNVYRPPRRDQFLCRECHGLLYRSQTHRSPLARALERMENAREQLDRHGVSRETLRECYEAHQDLRTAYNDYQDDLDDQFGEHQQRWRFDDLPPFEEWVADLLDAGLGRDYGLHGRCEATAQTTGERCRQPATGTHGKCYYHGGAEGSGVSEAEI